MLSCWFLNGSKISLYMLCTNLGQFYLHFVVLFCACWSIFGPLCPFLSPSSSFSIFLCPCLYLWLPFQAVWRSCWYVCAELSTSTTALFSLMGSLPRLSSSKHLVSIRCSCVSSKAFRYLTGWHMKASYVSHSLSKLESLFNTHCAVITMNA